MAATFAFRRMAFGAAARAAVEHALKISDACGRPKAESFDAAVAERTRNQRLARFPMPHFARFGRKTTFANSPSRPRVVQRAGAVGADLYSRADFAEPRCLLQHHDLEIRPREGQRQR